MSCILAAQGCVGSRYARAQAPFGRNNVPCANTAKSVSTNAPTESPTRCQYVVHRRHAMRASAAAPAGGSMDEASFFIRNLRALPWQRAAVWLVVVAAASQLSDFFGVRFHPQRGFCAAVASWQWPCVTACVSSCVTMASQFGSACTLKRRASQATCFSRTVVCCVLSCHVLSAVQRLSSARLHHAPRVARLSRGRRYRIDFAVPALCRRT